MLVQQGLDTVALTAVEHDAGGSRVLVQASNAARAGDGDDVIATAEQPGQSQLGRRVAPLARQCDEGVGQGQVSVEGDTLAFRASGTPQGGVPTWFARDGRRLGAVFAPPIAPILFPQISPDGTRLAATVGPSLWVFPLDGRPPVRLTVGDSLSPRWSPGGQSIFYERFGAVAGLAAISADGSSSVPRAVGPPGHFHAHGFVDGGVLAAFGPPGSGASWQIVRVPSSGTDAPVRVGDIAMPDGAAAAPDAPAKGVDDGAPVPTTTGKVRSGKVARRAAPARTSHHAMAVPGTTSVPACEGTTE